jgi:glutathione S-transferase
MLKIWGRRTSSNVQAVMWTVAELDLPFQRIDVGGKFGGVDTPEYLEMNPNGLVPVLIDGDDEPLFESAAIVRYLASRYGTGPFWPEDPRARAQIDKWAEWGKVTFTPVFGAQVFVAIVRTPPGKHDPVAIRKGIEGVARLLAMAERQLEKHTFLAGDDLTVADVTFGYLLYRYFTLEIDRPDFPAVQAYYDRLTQRPAYRENVMVSYDELRAR